MYYTQVLPFASDETLSQLESNCKTLPAISDLLAMGMSLETLTQALLQDIGIDEESTNELVPNYGPCEESALKVCMTRVHFDRRVSATFWAVSFCGP